MKTPLILLLSFCTLAAFAQDPIGGIGAAGVDLGSSLMSTATMNSAIGAGTSKVRSKTARPVPNASFRANPAVTERVKGST